ncbi:MAG: NifU family protein [Candidatus Omnitrophota bacterium]|nr:NifU family protein [Candidatus Omnitrophota bacterium]
MKEKVEDALNEVREILRMDGGDVELVDVTEDGVVKVRLIGACGHCPFATYTLKTRVEKMVKDKVPEVKSVEMA